MDLAGKGSKLPKLKSGPIGHPTLALNLTPTPSESQSSLPGSSPPPDDVEMPSIEEKEEEEEEEEENVVSPEPKEEVFVTGMLCQACRETHQKDTAGREMICSSL